MRTRRSILALLLASGCALLPGAAAAQAFEYAVKVVCGRSDAPIAGTYATVVNIHNPARDGTEFRLKVAVAAAGREGRITPFRTLQLHPDGAVAITCREVRDMAQSTNVDGFVVIQSRVDLDVVAVYSGAGNGILSTMDVERVTPRRMEQ